LIKSQILYSFLCFFMYQNCEKWNVCAIESYDWTLKFKRNGTRQSEMKPVQMRAVVESTSSFLRRNSTWRKLRILIYHHRDSSSGTLILAAFRSFPTLYEIIIQERVIYRSLCFADFAMVKYTLWPTWYVL